MKPVRAHERRIVLASGSPRRLELMRRVGLEPVVFVSSVPEILEPGEDPAEYTRRLAHLKASHVSAHVAARVGLEPDMPQWVLSADTIVVHEGQVLEKPLDPADARRMLARLSDTWHTVFTSFCWMSAAPEAPGELFRTRTVQADVRFRKLSPTWIDHYVESGEPMDKAGAYGIQDIGSTLVREIRGSYFCVVGLPVCEVLETLEEMGALEGYPFVGPAPLG